MADGTCPVQWTGVHAVVTLPDHVDRSNASQIAEELLSVINRGPAELIADMTGTLSCDDAGADAVVRAYQRAAVNGTQLRLVITAQVVRRLLTVNGLDRLIPVYPSLDAATTAVAMATVVPMVRKPDAASGDGHAAQRHAGWAQRRRAVAPRGEGKPGVVTQAVLGKVIDALADGVVLADDDGLIVLASRRTEDMFGYAHGELAGQLIESLLPPDLRAVHRHHRAGYAQEPRTRPMGTGMRLVGLRKDEATFPVEVSLSPVPTATGHLTLAVIRDVTRPRPHEDLIGIARAVIAAQQAHRGQDLLDAVAASLFEVGLSLQEAASLPGDLAQQRITEALQQLDDAIREIRDHVFITRGHSRPPGPGSPDGHG